ncbi:hypothetical protein [Halomonas sp. 15WGF]|uniref:hypothetical protein n=1 Tax=Halomonas sp. 15WGF TaxID=2570357 RepID=UPI0010BEBACA|nr:hypothetical protein [Halomonas sp. 15WGF]TKJ10798.1 hypothetical protein E8Q34_09525 [Halomonas sp. 15WGF]
MANTPLRDEPTQLHTLIHLGTGASPALSAYTQAAEHIWLVDACPEVQATLNNLAATQPNVHVSSALVDVEERAATFYRYSLPWASGPHPLSDELLQRYPGIKALHTHEQTTTAIHHLMAEMAVAKQQHNVLIMDLGAQNVPLMHALEQQGWLSAFTYLVVIPTPRTPLRLEELPSGVQAVAIPPSSVANLLPEPSEATVLQRHPLLLETQRLQAALTNAEQRQQETTQQIEALTKANNDANQQAEQHAQALTAEQEKTAQLTKERDQLAQQRDAAKQAASQQAEQHAQVLTAEQEKTAQLTQERDQLAQQRDEAKQAAAQQAEQHAQALTAEQEKTAQLTKERDKLAQQRDEAKQTAAQQAEQHAQALTAEQEKTAKLTQERDQLAQQRDEAKQAAAQQAEQHAQALKAEQEKIVQLNKQLESLNKSIEENRKETQQAHRTNEELRQQLKENTAAAEHAKEQLEQEQQYRQSLIDKELLKAEAQLELIKDILIKDKAF